MTSQVTRRGFLDMQVCVPKSFSDDEVTAFANAENPTGIDSKWAIRRKSDPALSGCAERVQCESLADHCHIMLDC